jgi:NAD+ synthase
LPAAALADALGVTPQQAQRIYDDIEAKRRAARYLHAPAETIEPIGSLTA